MSNDSQVRDSDQYARTLEEAGRRADAETRQIVASQQAEGAAKIARSRLPELPEDMTGTVHRARLLAFHKFESVPPHGDPNCIPSLRSAITEAARILLLEGHGAAYLEAFDPEQVSGMVDDLTCLARKDLRHAADDWLNRGIVSLTPERIEESLTIARIELEGAVRAKQARRPARPKTPADWIDRYKRAEGNISYEEIATRSSVSKTTLLQIRDGRVKNPNSESLKSIAATIDCDAEDLIPSPR